MKSPDTVFIESTEEKLTYSQAAERLKVMITTLSISGAKTVAIFADNRADWILVDFACQSLKICCIPLPLFFSTDQVQHVMMTADIDLLITDKKSRLINLTHLLTGEIAISNQLHGFKIRSQAHSKRPLNTTKITFTSGSTGSPKGVCLTTEQQWLVAQSLAESVNIDQSRHLCVLPLSTLLENIAGVYAPLLVTGTVIIRTMEQLGFNGSADFQLHRFLQTIERSQANTLLLLPQLLLAMVGAVEAGWKAPDSLQFIAVGGGRVATRVIERAHRCQLPVYEGYGLSECASVVSLNTSENDRPGSVGRPLPHLKVEIKNGEIFARDSLFSGYLNEPYSWYQSSLATGDLGHIDNEGFLYIDGRKKNILVSSYGRNINPEWIESELMNTPLVRQCIVFGDARPYCSALILPHQPPEDDSIIQHWIDETNARLPDYARVKAWARLTKPLSLEDGLLTDNGRVRRASITAFYQAEIEQLYNRQVLSV